MIRPLVVMNESFDDLRSPGVRLLQEASRRGEVHAYIWSDAQVRAVTGKDPRLTQEERLYLVRSLRWVAAALPTRDSTEPEDLPEDAPHFDAWIVGEGGDSPRRRAAARARGARFEVIPRGACEGFPSHDLAVPADGQAEAGHGNARKVVVTGCFDWVHSGHVRFFEEVAEIGSLYVVVGSDANIRLLKGVGHPLLPQEERRYLVQSIRFVHAAVISTGAGWLDAEPEIRIIRPDAYAVNRDGDKQEKRDFCAANGIQYIVLERTPRPGLPRRTSTDLRGF